MPRSSRWAPHPSRFQSKSTPNGSAWSLKSSRSPRPYLLTSPPTISASAAHFLLFDSRLPMTDPSVQAESAAIAIPRRLDPEDAQLRSEEHTSELQSLMRISYAVFCLKKKTTDLKT